MSFTHYPKLDDPILCLLHYYGPGDPRNEGTLPEPGGRMTLYNHSVNFTRYLGSLFCDQPLSLQMDFASDRYALPITPSGSVDTTLPKEIQHLFPVRNGVRDITDEDFPYLHYDARMPEIQYKPEQCGLKYWQIIGGVYLRLTLTHKGTEPIGVLRFSCCGSVF